MTQHDGLLPIGELARRTGLTTKALRHYHRVDLLAPAFVDPQTGYRYYTRAQLADAQLVHLLRSVDVPLGEVRECLASTDPDAVATALARHRRRVEARSIRLRGDLHTIDHHLKETPVSTPAVPAGPASPTSGPAPDGELHRRLAVDLFNGTWRLMEDDARTRADDDRMLHMAHASRYHWELAGNAVNLARGEWLCSRVYALQRRGEPSLHHAQRVLDLCQENEIGDWDLAFAYEALARAHAVCGDEEAARAATEQALACAEDVTDPEDRALVLADLETIPGQPRFW
ncbi:MerR family transcriptional regulator [Angustibacter luteus]|uniref:MerR family transcriptional regulator n=1 Tax=Angustibacter luteus TaxID=658456 RepID=A0ABW1J9I8_9ACTN